MLPPSIEADGHKLPLWRELSRIWTQKDSRRFGLYWSGDYGKLHPLPTTEELQRFYDVDDYSTYLMGSKKADQGTSAKRSGLAALVPRIAGRLDKGTGALAMIEGLPRNSAIDIGCGSGDFLNRLGFPDMVGVDPSPVSVGAVRKRGIEAHQTSAEALPEFDRTFDLVSMQQSLEHCLDPKLALENARRVCGGYLLIGVPNCENFGFRKYGPAWYHTDAGRHINFFTAKSLCKMIEATGFETVKIDYWGYARQFSHSWMHAMGEVANALDIRSPNALDPWLDFARSRFLSRAASYDVLRVLAKAV